MVITMWDGYQPENHEPNMMCVCVQGSKLMAFDLLRVLSQSLFDLFRSIKGSRRKCGNCTKVRQQRKGWLISQCPATQNKQRRVMDSPQCHNMAGPKTFMLTHRLNASQHVDGWTDKRKKKDKDGKKVNKYWLVLNPPVCTKIITAGMNVYKHTLIPEPTCTYTCSPASCQNWEF